MNTATTPTRNAPLSFWRIAQSFLQVLHALFGGPGDVAAQHTLTRKAHALMASWIRVGEALLRRLLLIEAAAMAPEEVTHTRARPSGSPVPAKRNACVSAPDPDHPESWRVSFRCPTADRRLRAGTARNKRTPSAEMRFLSAWPLAERFEAMLRAFDAPQAYARRLARRLRARPRRLQRILRAPPEYAHRVDRADELTHEARRAWRRPDSS